MKSATESGRVLTAASLALVIGVAVAVTLVLPAEYGVDPTGVGRALGLLVLAEPDAAVETDLEESVGGAAVARLSGNFTLAPGAGREFKVQMADGAQASFRWIADAPVHFDHHGEPAGDDSGYYESYAVGESAGIQGKFTALYAGTHGWYWRNDGQVPVTVDVVVAGAIGPVSPAGAEVQP